VKTLEGSLAGQFPGNFLATLIVDLHMAMHLHIPKAGLSWMIAGCLLLGGRALGDDRSMNCNGKVSPTHVELAEGDQNSATHLQLSRKVGSRASIDLDVCAADLRITGGSGDVFRVAVDIANPDSKLTAGDYIHTFDVTPLGVRLRLNLSKHVRAKVVVTLPATISNLEVNLVRGDLLLDTDRIGGERKINVVHGHVDLLANEDSYGTLQVNVVMGSFHDRRPAGEGHHVMVAQSLSGAGKGAIEINVVMGSVDLKPSA
jgi:hypothetical protein